MRASRGRLIGIAMSAALCVSMMVTPAAAASTSQAGIQELMDKLVAAGAFGVQVRYHLDNHNGNDQDDDHVLTSGHRDREGGGIQPDSRFRAGSITKTLVAATVLRLVEEGKLKLDDSVSGHLPDFDLNKDVTVEMLLNHTSGIPEYLNRRGELGLPMDDKNVMETIGRDWTPEELVRNGVGKDRDSVPTENSRYSNTNYVLAGLLIEKVANQGVEGARLSYRDIVTREVLDKLGMDQSSLPGAVKKMPAEYTRGYAKHVDSASGKSTFEDVSEMNTSWSHAAGELVTTTRDLDRFISGLVGGGEGKLLSAESWNKMTRFKKSGEFTGYGLGLGRVDQSGHEPRVGHQGNIPGYHSVMYSNLSCTKRFQISVNKGEIEDLKGYGNAREALIKALRSL